MEQTETKTVQRPSIFPLETLERASKNEKRDDLLARKDSGVGLGLVPALRFTRALSNGPEKQKEKRLWTDYSRLDIKHLLRWDLSPLPVHRVDSRC